MSVRTMARVWDGSKHSGTELLMLLAIADFADDAGNAYPSVSTLATKCRMQPRNATRILRVLEDSGELAVCLNEGPKGTNRYRVVLEALGVQSSTGVQSSAPLQYMVATPAIHGSQPLHGNAYEPSLNHQEPPKEQRRVGKQKSDQQTFRQWYDLSKPAADAIGDKVIPLSDPIRDYLTKLGLDRQFLILHFEWFKEKYLADDRKQKDWLATFRNSIKGNWAKLWYRTPDGAWRLTVAGKQFALAHDFDPEMQSQPESDWTGGAT